MSDPLVSRYASPEMAATFSIGHAPEEREHNRLTLPRWQPRQCAAHQTLFDRSQRRLNAYAYVATFTIK